MDKNIIEKIADTIYKLQPRFGSASLLEGLVRRFGLFQGRIKYDEGYWELDKDVEVKYAWSGAEYGWSNPIFKARYVNDNTWECCLGFGRHRVWLQFNTETGDVVNIDTDDAPSECCWEGYDDVEDRIKIVKRYINR